jgi:hypothetical protein
MHIHANKKSKQECDDKASHHDQCADAFATRKVAFCATMRVAQLGGVNSAHTGVPGLKRCSMFIYTTGGLVKR